jgi:hypothetical protein
MMLRGADGSDVYKDKNPLETPKDSSYVKASAIEGIRFQNRKNSNDINGKIDYSGVFLNFNTQITPNFSFQLSASLPSSSVIEVFTNPEDVKEANGLKYNEKTIRSDINTWKKRFNAVAIQFKRMEARGMGPGLCIELWHLTYSRNIIKLMEQLISGSAGFNRKVQQQKPLKVF